VKPAAPLRLTVTPDQVGADSIRLTREQTHYASHVRRLRAGAPLLLLGRDGGQWEGRLSDDATEAVELTASFPDQPTSGRLILAAALLRAHRWEWLLEKAVEVGADEIQPLLLEHNVAKPSDREASKIERWQRIIEAAAAQCGTRRMPTLAPPATLADWLKLRPEGSSLLFCDETSPLTPWPALAETTCLVIGPEGGLAPFERAALLAAGGRAVGLGPRILRAESAGMASLVIARALLDGRVTHGG
jgi:16S rRNA (uracil1498-N3)-methyltransferase